MSSIPDIDDSRRRFLLYALSAGVLSSIAACSTKPTVYQAMPMPAVMPAEKSIFQYVGEIKVNSVPATLSSSIKPGDVVETGATSQMIFVVNQDAFLLRSNSRIRIPTNTAGGMYDLDQGKALGVFASRQTGIRTPSAVIAIRGTGVYIEVEPDLSYVCNCYGLIDLATADNPAISETIKSTHHDAPRYVLADQGATQRILPAPFKNHDDQDLMLIETLVGRTTPYVVPKGVKRVRGSYI